MCVNNRENINRENKERTETLKKIVSTCKLKLSDIFYQHVNSKDSCYTYVGKYALMYCL